MAACSKTPLGAHYCESPPIDTHRVPVGVVHLHFPELSFGEVVHVVKVECQQAVPEWLFPASGQILQLQDNEATNKQLASSSGAKPKGKTR